MRAIPRETTDFERTGEISRADPTAFPVPSFRFM